MADSVSTEEVASRRLKVPKLGNSCDGSKCSSKQRELRLGEGDDDEYLRQYLLFHYQYEKTQGFSINWEEFDYVLYSRSLDEAPPLSKTRSNAELIREVTQFAIEKHNEAEGTKLEFVEHIEANYKFINGLLYWITFWGRDMSSSSPESKIYQAKVWRRGKEFEIPIFRLKPTDEEIDSVQVQPPSPMRYKQCCVLFVGYVEKPPIVFSRPGPEDDALPGVPFVFNRTGAGLDPPDRFYGYTPPSL